MIVFGPELIGEELRPAFDRWLKYQLERVAAEERQRIFEAIRAVPFGDFFGVDSAEAARLVIEQIEKGATQ